MINISNIRQLTSLQNRYLQSEFMFYKITFDKVKDKFPSDLFSEKANGAKLLSCLNLKAEGRYEYVFMFRKADASKINILNLSYRQKHNNINLSTSIFDYGKMNIAQQYQILLGATLTADNNATGSCYYVVENRETEVKSIKVTFGIYEGFLMINLPAIVTFRKKKEKALDDKYKYYVSGFCVNKVTSDDNIEKERLCYLPNKHDYSDKKKNTLPFHKLLFDDKFKSTKLYVLYFIGKKFNEYYKGMIDFPFPGRLLTVAEFMKIEALADSEDKNVLPRIKTEILEDNFCLKGKTVKLIDGIGNDDSRELMSYLKAWCTLKEMKVVKGKAAYSIQLVHNEKYYKTHRKETDAYSNNHFQHLTFETLKASVRTYKKENWDKSKLPPEIKTLFWEMIITDDILNNQCSTIGEHENEINIGVNFYLKGKDGQEGVWHHGTLVIDRENRMSFADETSLCNDMGSMLLEVTGKKNASVIIIGIGKNIVCVEDTDIFLIPDHYEELIKKYDDYRNLRYPVMAFDIPPFAAYLTSASVKDEKKDKLIKEFTDVIGRIDERFPGKDNLSIFELLSTITDKSCRYHISRYLESKGYGELFAHEREQTNIERFYGSMKGFVYGIGKMSNQDDYYYAAPDGEGIGQNPYDKAIRIYHKWDIEGHVPMPAIMPYLTAGWYALDNTSWPCIKKYLEEWLRRKYKNEWEL
ncbi:MAG: hypothetical protein IKM76_11950 [Prevotella sp.]|nr:hypothetical protein [Prevotella sp.]